MAASALPGSCFVDFLPGEGFVGDEGFDVDGSTSLGLSIVRTLVESELGGRLLLGAGPTGGTRVELDVPL